MVEDVNGAEKDGCVGTIAEMCEMGQLKRRVERARSKLDLCFLVDATGSMAQYIEALKDSIRLVVDRLEGRSSDGVVEPEAAIVEEVRIDRLTV